VRVVRILGIILAAGVLMGAGPNASLDAESQFLSALHSERYRRNLRPLTVDAYLTSLARAHAERMAGARALFHSSDVGQRTVAWAAYAENVAAGSSVQEAQKALMDSSTHRANILDPEFDDVGIGAATAGGLVWVTQVFADRFPTPPTTAAPPTTTAPIAPVVTLPTTVPPTTVPPTTVAPTTTVVAPTTVAAVPPTSLPAGISLVPPASTPVSPGAGASSTSVAKSTATSVAKAATTPVTQASNAGTGSTTAAPSSSDPGADASLSDMALFAQTAGTAATEPTAVPGDNRTVIAVTALGMALAAQTALVLRRRRIWDR